MISLIALYKMFGFFFFYPCNFQYALISGFQTCMTVFETSDYVVELLPKSLFQSINPSIIDEI